MSDMDDAHRRDYRDKAELQHLRATLEEFLEKPPPRCSPRTEDAIDKVVALLERDEAQIVLAWN